MARIRTNIEIEDVYVRRCLLLLRFRLLRFDAVSDFDSAARLDQARVVCSWAHALVARP